MVTNPKPKNFSQSTHYAISQNMVEMIEKSIRNAKQLVESFEGKKYIPILIYSGMSGIALATGLAMELHRTYPNFNFAMGYIRKPDEKSHGHILEYSLPRTYYDGNEYIHIPQENLKFTPVFVDDMVSSGVTLFYTYEKFLEEFNIRNNVKCFILDNRKQKAHMVLQREGLREMEPWQIKKIKVFATKRTRKQKAYIGKVAKAKPARDTQLKNLFS